MATDLDPNTRTTTSQDPMTRANEPIVDRQRSSMAPYAVAVGVAVALALGLMVWGMNDRNTAGVNTAPGVTTGSSTTTAPSSTTTVPMTRPMQINPDANKTDTK